MPRKGNFHAFFLATWCWWSKVKDTRRGALHFILSDFGRQSTLEVRKWKNEKMGIF
jgi:hypothetical protein